MLYDPKWEQQTKADPFSLASLIEWLERRPAKEAYQYTCNGHCLIAQYLKHLGHTEISVCSFGDFDTAEGNWRVPTDIWQVAIGRPHTFGDALKRARKFAAHTVGQPSIS